MGETTTSRRSLLTALATLPVAALPTVAATASGDDAALLAFGRKKFDPLYRQWVESSVIDHREQFELEVAIEDITGVKLADVSFGRTKATVDEGEEDLQRTTYWRTLRCNALKQYDRARGGQEEDDPAEQALWDALREAAGKILTFNATTREGLALQARAMVYLADDSIAPTFEWDGEAEDQPLRNLLESLCGFAGLPFPAYRHYVDMLLDREEM